MSMSVMERKQGSAGSGSPIKDQLYYPSPYAMSHIPMFQKQGSPESECSQTLRRNFGREHIYDVPYPPKWVSYYFPVSSHALFYVGNIVCRSFFE